MLIYPIFIPQWGCPQQCIYCNQNKITDTEGFDTQAIMQGVKAFVTYHKGSQKQIAFYGGSFTALNPSERSRLLQPVLELLDSETSIRISTRPDCIDGEVLDYCLHYGIRTIELGIQDFSDNVLRKTGRSYDSETAQKACDSIIKSGFELGVQLMPGLPGSNEESLHQNHQLLIQIKPSTLRLYPLIVISGTALETLYLKGLYRPLELDTAVEQCADYCELADKHAIKVIKLGLPSTLRPEDIVAGPYHPAFGEFVRAELLIRQLERDHKPGARISLDRKQVSLLHGHKAKYLNILHKRLDSCTLDIEYR